MQKYVRVKERLVFRRNRLGLTQEGLAEKSGISVRSISDYERGLSDPSLEQLSKLASALEVTSGWLLGESGADEVNEQPAKPSSELSAAYVHLETATLQKSFSELASKLNRVSALERKYVFGNLRAMLDELEDRDLKSASLTPDAAALLGAKKVLAEVENPGVVYGRSRRAASTSGKTSSPSLRDREGSGVQPTPPKQAPK